MEDCVEEEIKNSRFGRAYFSSTIETFLTLSDQEVLGRLAASSQFDLVTTQRDAWLVQIAILKVALRRYEGAIYFEFVVPRMGQRIDVVVIIGHAIFVIEFKVGEKKFLSRDREQVWDYALDLKNFHETSHHVAIAPILVPTAAEAAPVAELAYCRDSLLEPILCTSSGLAEMIGRVLEWVDGEPIDSDVWEVGRYYPTPTIIEAARSLYRGHGVEAISRRDATARNLATTSDALEAIIADCKENSRKALCFVTGVPGAGKTLVGLNIATRHRDKKSELFSVFLSGNGPLVNILCEALARDKVARKKQEGSKFTLKEARSEVKAFVQNVHHFRDSCLTDPSPPIEHVALFDEAQRAWDLEQTTNFMRRKKGVLDFDSSEPEFLISCLNRHRDWAVVVCLVGGGQEINTGEAGISEWLRARDRSFRDWDVYLSPRLEESEYALADLKISESAGKVVRNEDLHLSVSLRSFRAENLSKFVKELLERRDDMARETLKEFSSRYPIRLTRSLDKAKAWLRSVANGSERFGMVVSSRAERLKPHAIDIRVKTDPVVWFLNGREDVRSSYYLEDAATEFDVQGLELDWACLVWDGDFRSGENGWEHWSFSGDKWQRVRKPERQRYLLNAYRVLLTRARQGFVIVVPEGSSSDPTRDPSFYDPTYRYLLSLGIEQLP